VDIEGAKALLEEAGYGDGLDISIVGMQDQNPVFVVMQENLKQAGINLTINIVDTPQFVEQANGGTYDIIHVGDLQDARYPTIFSSLRQALIDTFCIGGCKYTTPEIEEMVDAVIQEPDEEKAKENAKTLEEYLKQEMMFSNTYPEMHAAITGADIKGYRTMERGFLDATGFYR
jgi:peptide/nickel transport system substrate-binding protein